MQQQKQSEYYSVPMNQFSNGNSGKGNIMSPLDDIDMEEDFEQMTGSGPGLKSYRRRSLVDKMKSFFINSGNKKVPLKTFGSIVFVIFMLILIGVLSSQSKKAQNGSGDSSASSALYGESYLNKQYPNRIKFNEAIYEQFNLQNSIPEYAWVDIGQIDTAFNQRLRQLYPDGSFYKFDYSGNICINHITQPTTGCGQVFIDFQKILDPQFGTPLTDRIQLKSLQLSSSGKYLLFSSDAVQRWRRSSYSRYWIYSFELQQLKEIAPFDVTVESDRIIFAKLSLSEDFVAYVFKNNLFILSIDCYFKLSDNSCQVKVTNDGTSDFESNPDGKVIYNGIADWVYEEEVFETPDAFWWSPKAENSSLMMLAYVKFDDTKVSSNTLQKFIYGIPQVMTHHHDFKLQQYSYLEKIKYPKPGRMNQNPNISLNVFAFNLSSSQSFQQKIDLNISSKPNDTEIILYNVQWSPIEQINGTDMSNLYLRLTDRLSSVQEFQRFSFNLTETPKLEIRQELSKSERLNGWFETGPDLLFIPDTDLILMQVLKEEGDSSYLHWAAVNRLNFSQIVYLSQGKWEVRGPVLRSRKLQNQFQFWFLGNKDNGNRIDRFLYSIKFNLSQDSTVDSSTLAINQIVSTDSSLSNSWYGAQVSQNASFVALNYLGPSQPKQLLLQQGQTNQSTLFQSNMNQQLSLPRFQFIEIKLYDEESKYNYIVNGKLWKPLGLNENSKQKYPLFVTGYWGPNSQKVNAAWDVGLNDYLSSHWHSGTKSAYLEQLYNKIYDSQLSQRDKVKMQMELEEYLLSIEQPPFAVLVLDVRGSGGIGTKYREVVTKRLGMLESQDVLKATQQFISQNLWIDEEKVAIFGWSYGGFMAAKVIEQMPQNQTVFKAAVSVAPVTHWAYYDSIYTERYMKNLQDNLQGYQQSRIVINDNFAKVKFLAIHGSADDNVDFQNTMSLEASLQAYHKQNQNEKFSDSVVPDMLSPNGYNIRIITDDNHSMQLTPRAYETVMKLVVDWIVDAFKEVDEIREKIHQK